MSSNHAYTHSNFDHSRDQGSSHIPVPESMSKDEIRKLIRRLMQSYPSVKAIPAEEIEAMVTIIHCQQADPALSHVRRDLQHWIRSTAQGAQHHSSNSCRQIVNPSNRDSNPDTPSDISDNESLELDDERSDFYVSTPATTNTSTSSSTHTTQSGYTSDISVTQSSNTSSNFSRPSIRSLPSRPTVTALSIPVNAMRSADPSAYTSLKSSSASRQHRYHVPALERASNQSMPMPLANPNPYISHTQLHSTPNVPVNVKVNIDPSVAYWNRIEDMAHRYLGSGPRPRIDRNLMMDLGGVRLNRHFMNGSYDGFR